MDDEFSKLGFAKTYLVPVALIAVLPLFSLWFFRYAENTVDERVRESILKSIRADRALKETERKNQLLAYQSFRASQLVTTTLSPAYKHRALVERHAYKYRQFRIARQLAWLCVVTAGGALLLGVLALLLSLRSQVAQYWSLAIGWHSLKLVCALQVVLQGVLAIGLSYWVTALFTNRGEARLILWVGLAAVAAIAALVHAVFQKIDTRNEIDGALLEPERAPSFWARIEQMTTQLGIPKPDQIIVGIDTNFFVTEHPLIVSGREVTGRTLFMSLPMLKILEKEEAASIMAHEMGHFSGQDTLYSRKTSPILARWAAYLDALSEQTLARPVFHFMLFFRMLFELSLRRTGREREFRADAIAVRLTSKQAFASAMIKTCAYIQYRGQVESKLFEQEKVMQTAHIAAGIAEGFPAFAAQGVSLEDLGEATTTHPFDSHPPVHQRLAAAGVVLDPRQREQVLLAGVQETWNAEIRGADELEAAQWKAYEAEFRDHHEKSLAYRYLPATDEERKLVEQHFPPVQLDPGIRIDFESLRMPGWTDAVRFEHMDDWELADEDLTIKHRRPDGSGNAVHKIDVSKLPGGGEAFLEAFSSYYERHAMAHEFAKVKQENQA